MQNSPAFNQNMGGAMGMQGGATPGANFAQPSNRPGSTAQQFQTQQDFQKQQYIAKLQAAQQQLQAQRQHDNVSEISANNWTAKQNGQALLTRNNAIGAQAQEARANEQNFMSSFTKWATQHQIVLDHEPRICGRPVSYFQLFMALTKTSVLLQGPNRGKWNMISSCLGFPEVTHPTAAEEAKQLVERNLAQYYSVWANIMQRRKAQLHQQQQEGEVSGNSLQSSPTQPIQSSGAAMDSQSNFAPQSHPPMVQPRVQRSMSQTNSMMNDASNSATPAISSANLPTPYQVALGHGGPASTYFPGPSSNHIDQLAAIRSSSHFPSERPEGQVKERSEDTTKGLIQVQGTEYKPRVYPIQTYGGFDLPKLADFGTQLFRLRSSLAVFEDVIDIHSLTRSLQSGMHDLVTRSLDQLIAVSRDRTPLALTDCEDLLDALLDCLEEQLDLIRPNVVQGTDDSNFRSFDSLTKASRLELETVTETPDFASAEYEHERAIDRTIGITTILRNLSFYEVNYGILTSPPVVSVVCDLIRLLGCEASVLINARNAQDLMKDLVTFLSNTADKIELMSLEDAQCVLYFLLAFAPQGTTSHTSSNTRRFSSYVPTMHQYLPCAVDSLAKILARDNPNRAFYRTIFQADSASSEPYGLLTRTFGLAISPIPDRTKGHISEVRVSEARKPFLGQGMLAADILASLAPGVESGVARSWLESEDGWAPSLLRMIIALAMDRTSTAPQRRQSAQSYEGNAFGSITHRAIAMLQKLAEKLDLSRGDDGAPTSRAFAMCTPVEETILSALMDQAFDQQVLRQVMAFSKMGR